MLFRSKLAVSTRPMMRRVAPGARSLLAIRGIGPVELAWPALGHASVQPLRDEPDVLPLGEGAAPPQATSSTASRGATAVRNTLFTRSLYPTIPGVGVPSGR